MNGGEAFFDTNVLLYLLSGDEARADQAEKVIAGGGIISVQVLNEFASVATRKLGMSWTEIREILSQVRAVCDSPYKPMRLY
jgi:predicted nucleic acid-binding protein